MNSTNLSGRRPFTEQHRSDLLSAAAQDRLVEQALAQWIEADGRARLLVDGACKICWMNAAAESLVSGAAALIIRNGHLRTRENRFERRLQEFIDGAGAQVSTCCVVDVNSGERVVLTASRLGAPPGEMVALTLLRVDDDFAFDLADLRSAFGFTPSEASVTYRLMCGRTAEEAAQDLGVSLATVRTHIKRTYAKLGVSSREGFFHRLTPFVILLA